MKQVYLYIVNHYVPRYLSEYGGLWNVVAENDEQCFNFICEKDADDLIYDEYYDNLRRNIVNARKFLLSEDVECGIVNYMIT